MQPIRTLTLSAADLDSLPAVTPADILRGAARYLETRGWCQNSFFSATSLEAFPAACLEGSIRMAAYGSTAVVDVNDPAHRDRNRAHGALIDHLFGVGAIDITDDEPGPDFTKLPLSPAEWNDIPGRTATEVIDALRAAADEWDRQHTAMTGGNQS